jgi:hypothetical protein
MRARLRGVEIGPTVSHKGVAIHHWLGGCEPLAVARKIDHPKNGSSTPSVLV